MPRSGLITQCFIFSLLFFPMTLLAAPNNIEKTDTATAVVESLQSHLLESMQTGTSWSTIERREYFTPVVKEHFDIEFMSRVILGRYWKQLDDDQKSRFIEQFTELSIVNFAQRFNSYTNETFNVLDKTTMKKNRFLVKTELLTADNAIHKLDYLLHKPDQSWLIISITADGVNELSLRRAEYAGILKNQGFEALLLQIREQITRQNAQ